MSLKPCRRTKSKRLRSFVLLMKQYAESFYFSPAWRKTAKAYTKSVGGLCERCKEKGIVRAGQLVHHKVHITPDNIGDVNITLNWDNLQLVCRDCHAELHKGLKRYKVDEFGHVTGRE